MSKVEALKEQARRYEQKEEWQRACDLYMEAIDRLDEEAADIGLHNRVGDILIKLGAYDRAVEHFDKATDLYLEAELPNNAIAVCKKVIRHLPNRYETYLKMGQIRAGQGFLVDARQNFLAYAERMQAAGKVEEGLRALAELADLAPEDLETRMSVATQLLQHERPQEALEQLAAGYAALRRKGDEEGAAAFAEQILAIDGDADLDALAVSEPSEDELRFESTSLAQPEESGLAVQIPEVEGGAPESALDEFQEILLPGAGGGADGGAGPAEAAPGPAAPEDREEDAGIPPDLPLLSFDHEAPPPVPGGSVDAGAGSTDGPDVDAGSPPDLDLDVDQGSMPDFHLDLSGGDPDSDDEEPSEPLPLLSLDDDGDPAEAGEVETSSAGEGKRTTDVRTAWEHLRARCATGSGNVELSEELVEVAFRLGDPQVLVESYLMLATALETSGEGNRARAVLEQVLALDPGNDQALRRLERDRSSPPSPSEPRGDGGHGDYVDLGSLIFGDEGEEKTTRFRVAYEEPSGDEEADFARLLTQFKEKVAENFDLSDVKAHHDLGLAYKEMGLLDEAVEKFQAALRASPIHLPTYELLGQTFMEKGELTAAIRVLERALRVSSDVEDEFIGIYYYLARAHEARGATDRALDYYDQVFALDINFKDVTDRLRSLR